MSIAIVCHKKECTPSESNTLIAGTWYAIVLWIVGFAWECRISP